MHHHVAQDSFWRYDEVAGRFVVDLFFPGVHLHDYIPCLANPVIVYRVVGKHGAATCASRHDAELLQWSLQQREGIAAKIKVVGELPAGAFRVVQHDKGNWSIIPKDDSSPGLFLMCGTSHFPDSQYGLLRNLLSCTLVVVSKLRTNRKARTEVAALLSPGQELLFLTDINKVLRYSWDGHAVAVEQLPLWQVTRDRHSLV